MAKFCCPTTVIIVLMTLLKHCSAQHASKDTATTQMPTSNFLAQADDVLTKDVAPDFTFAVWDQYGKICMLAKFIASFKITYPSTDGEQQVTINMPDYAKAKGRCGTPDREPFMEISWPGYRLGMIFTVVNPKVNHHIWELLSMELQYDTVTPIFDRATNVGKKTVRTLDDGLFAASYGKSYFCLSPDVIPMYNSKREKVVLARMTGVHIQVYDVQMGRFSQFQLCSSGRTLGSYPSFESSGRNKTVLLAVGSTLAGLAVLAILGYVLWRKRQ